MFLILILISFIHSTECKAKMNDDFFAGLSLQGESIKFTDPLSKTYSGFSYGMIVGKDWSWSNSFGLKSYLGIISGSLSNNSASMDNLSIISPVLGVGFNMHPFSLLGSVIYHSYSTGTNRSQNIGLQGEALYTQQINSMLSLQPGAFFGETTYNGSVGTNLGIIFRVLLNFRAAVN